MGNKSGSDNLAFGQGEEHGSKLEAAVQNRLGAMLKRHYDDLVSAPIPDQFLVLLAELEAKERANDR